MKIIGITGTIGSGKSVVCKCLETMGYSVYDTDSNARRIMDTSATVRSRLKEELSEEIFNGEIIDRKRLAGLVFNNEKSLSILNSIVHKEVANDLTQWIERKKAEEAVFIESAILFSSGFDKFADEVWIVDAPRNVRCERVVKFRGMVSEDFHNRDKNQTKENFFHSEIPIFRIINDGCEAVLPQVENLIRRFN